MEPKIHIKPSDPDSVIPMEDGKRLPKEGAEVIVSRYYRRRIADGSVKVVELAKKAAPAKPAAPAKAKED